MFVRINAGMTGDELINIDEVFKVTPAANHLPATMTLTDGTTRTVGNTASQANGYDDLCNRLASAGCLV